MSGVDLAAVATPFVWLGMVLAISFMEAPLKFRAPGITLALGLRLGRLVFAALNSAEIALAVMLAVAGVAAGVPRAGWFVFALVVALLAVQVLVLRPRLDRRINLILAGQSPRPSPLHLTYVAAEVLKVLALSVLGAVAATAVLS